MIIQVNQLKEIINFLRSSVKDKDITVSNTLLHFNNNYIYTTDGFVTSLCNTVNFDFKCSVSFLELSKVINKIKKDSINIEYQEDKLVLTDDEILVDLYCIDNLHDFNFNESFEFIDLPEDFNNGLFLSSFSVSEDLSMSSITNLVIGKDGFLSTDRVRISKYNCIIDDDLIIPYFMIKELKKYVIVSYFKKEGRIFFKTSNGFIISCIEGSTEGMPNLLDFFKQEYDLSIKLPDKLKDKLDLASVFEGEGRVTLLAKNNKLKIIAKNDAGKITVTQKIDNDKEFSFSIHSGFLNEILQYTKELKLNERTACFELENFIQIISLS